MVKRANRTPYAFTDKSKNLVPISIITGTRHKESLK